MKAKRREWWFVQGLLVGLALMLLFALAEKVKPIGGRVQDALEARP